MSQEFKTKMYELENSIESPSFAKINSQLMDMASILTLLDKTSTENKELIGELQTALYNTIVTVREEQTKQDQLKDLAFMLANKIR